MAMNLKQHNLMSKEEAINQAERLYGKENDYSKEQSNQQQSNDMEDLRKEVRKLTFAMRDMTNELVDTKKKLDDLEKQLNDARVGMSRRPAPQPGQENSLSLANNQPAAARDMAKPIDRNQVAPKDVSIDKFFYYGK
ncbi:MAG: hypothetical protein HGA85_04730 [Nanoarchaeota archaeon]|nr:hypothetical protein [Nanoarchaeota archaeon]